MWFPRGEDRCFEFLPSQVPAPKVWPVAESAWQIRLPLPWALTSVNVFLFRARNGYILLDTGIRTPDCLLALDVSLASLGVPWSSIVEILVSHLHPDHLGAAAEVRRRSGAPVRMPGREAKLVRPLAPNRKFFGEAAAFLRSHGVPADQVTTMRKRAKVGAGASERLVVDGSIDDGERIEFQGGTLEVVPAPGHSPAQVCLHCPDQRVLFSTDAILPKVTPNIGVQWFYQDDPLGDYFKTLSALEALEVDTVLPSHGRPFQGHREWIANTRRHHLRRCETILGAMPDVPASAYRIAGSVWGEDISLMDRRFAMAEALSHLHYMALRRQVERVRTDGITHWRPA